MRFQLVDANKAAMSVERLCALLDVSVSGFYAWKNRVPCRRQLDDLVLLAHIRAQFATSHQTYGAPRMFEALREDGIQAGKHRIARLMRDNGLMALYKRRYRKTTDSSHSSPVAGNLLEQDFQRDGPDEK